MSIFSSPRFLPRVLLVDAASGFACGFLHLAFTGAMAQWLNQPQVLVQGLGWFLLAYGVFAAYIGTRRPMPHAAVWLLVFGNLAWGLVCVALLLSDRFQPAQTGVAYVVLQTVWVLAMAQLQWLGLRHAPTASLSAA